jgi:sigma-E factor negative regulatory protein RseA
VKERISALMDDEAAGHEVAGSIESLKTEGEARESWRAYHLIGDVMRETELLSGGFNARLRARLEKEPTVMAPGASHARPERARWRVLSAAASVAAVALVGGVYFSSLQQPEAPLAKAPANPPAPEAASQLVHVAPPETADDYLLAHQGYSPRVSFQGMAVRVANEARGGR